MKKLEKEILDDLDLIATKDFDRKTNIVYTNNHLFQNKYNLLWEANEGYSKLNGELSQRAISLDNIAIV